MLGLLTLFVNIADADLSRRPDVNGIFSPDQESKIMDLASLSTPLVFSGLKDADFAGNRDLSYKAVYVAFNTRRQEALAVAQNYLKELIVEVVEGRRIDRSYEFDIAKQVFEVFPDEGMPLLENLYNRSDSITRGNIIRVIGAMEGEGAVRAMLIKALNDSSFAEEEDPAVLGDPMRVCDIAYNQVVLRYSVLSVLRTISPALKLADRDYHLSILKSDLGSYLN